MQDRRSNTLTGTGGIGSLKPSVSGAIFILLVALGLASFSGGLMKILTATMEPALISFFRFLGYFILLFPLALFQHGKTVFKPTQPKVQILRGCALVFGNTAFIYGVQHVDYANSIAILYIYPFIMISFSVWILNETVSRGTWLGVVGGFAGVILVLRPNIILMDFNGLFIVFAGMMVALQMLLNRKLGMVTSPLIVAVWGALVACIMSSLLVPFFWNVPSKSEIFIIIILSTTTALSQTLMIVAMSWASADKIAPFTYFEIPSATLVGLLLFQTLPDILSLVGMALIIFSGLLVKLFSNKSELRLRNKF